MPEKTPLFNYVVSMITPYLEAQDLCPKLHSKMFAVAQLVAGVETFKFEELNTTNQKFVTEHLDEFKEFCAKRILD